MSDTISVEIFLFRQRNLEEDQLPDWQAIELLKYGCFEQRFGFSLLRAMNVHFRLDYRHEAGRHDLRSHFELLVYDLSDPGWVGLVDHRAHLGPENAPGPGLVKQRS